jgi:epoxyqueuosine reductase
VFGCDDCLAVCPWNKFALAARHVKLAALAGAASPPLGELLALDDRQFRDRFAGSPVKRTGRDRVVRNALIAAGNSGDVTLIPTLQRLLDDASPLVRAMAIWALRRLAPEAWRRLRDERAAGEPDGDVRREWGSLS